MTTPEDGVAASPTGVLETIQLEHVPLTHTVHIAVFKDVTNSEFLHQQLLSRNAEYEYAFIDASSVCITLQSPLKFSLFHFTYLFFVFSNTMHSSHTLPSLSLVV